MARKLKKQHNTDRQRPSSQVPASGRSTWHPSRQKYFLTPSTFKQIRTTSSVKNIASQIKLGWWSQYHAIPFVKLTTADFSFHEVTQAKIFFNWVAKSTTNLPAQSRGMLLLIVGYNFETPSTRKFGNLKENSKMFEEFGGLPACSIEILKLSFFWSSLDVILAARCDPCQKPLLSLRDLKTFSTRISISHYAWTSKVH